MLLWLSVIIIFVIAIAVLSGPLMSRVEQAKYTLAESFNDIEIRDYPPMIVAEVEVRGQRADAANKGFRLLASYLFGDNTAQHTMAMTAPVIQKSTKIAMTAPVTQRSDKTGWKVRFVMPSSYTIETLPRPTNNLVKLIPTESKRYAVIRFSGTSSESNLKTHLQKLLDFLNKQNIKTISEPIYAFFNPPWTLPILRRNEIMIEIQP